MFKSVTIALRGSLVALLLAGVAVVADAQTAQPGAIAKAPASEDESIEAGLAASAQADRARRRAYLGGSDEQELTVQASLPQPLRNPDALPTPPKNAPKPSAD